MKPAKAIAILSIPFAAISLALLSGMCLTPYWDCSQVPLTLDLWQPALFLLVAFTVVAVVILYVDLLLIREVIHKLGSSRLLALAVLGAITATLPRIILGAFGGLGISSVAPRLEFVPFAVAGALFAIALYKLLGIERKQ